MKETTNTKNEPLLDSNGRYVMNIDRNTTLKYLFCYISQIMNTAKKFDVELDIYPIETTNYIFHVNIELRICATSASPELLLNFEKTLDKNG